MPITRRPETNGDAFDPYIRSLWSRKWLIIGLALLAGIITYIVLGFVPEKFRVTSEVFVNQLSSINEDTAPNPETVSSLLKSQGVLEKVRNDYVREFNVSSPPKIENFIKQFSVESLILQDTTVRKQFSPVLSLQVESEGSSATRYIMERWIHNFIDEFGNYTTQEAVIKRDAFIEEKKRIEDEIQKLEILRAQQDSQLPLLRRMLAEKLDLLTPSRLNFSDQEADAKLDITLTEPRLRPGLLEQYSALELNIKTGQAPTTAPAALAQIANAINDAQTSVSHAEQVLADARFKELQTRRLLSQLTDTQNAVNAAISKFTVAAAIYNKSFEGGIPKGGDIRALSVPITPENRIWPRRTLTSGIVTILVGILAACWVVGNDFSRRFFRSES